jgi:hypothetical protein
MFFLEIFEAGPATGGQADNFLLGLDFLPTFLSIKK